ncbi:hypothetical protein SRHO_G00321860 [Serrasalmus rhombeus]
MAVAAAQITHPEPFDFSNTAEWPRWIRRFERFRLASGLSKKPEDYQVNSLLYAMGDEADDILAVLPLTLLGLPVIEALSLVHRIDAVTQQHTPNFVAAYPSVFSGLGLLQEPNHIELEKDATPYALSTPRRVPLPLRDKVKEELDRMESMGVISKVSSPTEWCAGMVVVPKPSGNIRICVDLTNLNKWVKRECHILPSVDQSLAMLSNSKVFTKLDARSGFWQIPLTNESKPLTTFITPFGRYFFNRLPFGIVSAPEHFQRRMLQLLENYDGVICHADYILVFGRDKMEHDQLCARCCRNFNLKASSPQE